MPHQGTSNEYPNMFSWRNKKNNDLDTPSYLEPCVWMYRLVLIFPDCWLTVRVICTGPVAPGAGDVELTLPTWNNKKWADWDFFSTKKYFSYFSLKHILWVLAEVLRMSNHIFWEWGWVASTLMSTFLMSTHNKWHGERKKKKKNWSRHMWI